MAAGASVPALIRRSFVDVVITMGTLVMSACSGPTVSSYDRLRAAVNEAAENGIFLLRDVGQGASRSNVVVLVGERRASVAAQRELAMVLDMLVETNAINAILVERPSGPISTMRVRRVLEHLDLTEASMLSQRWAQLLDAGEIPAYEYALLTKPGLVGFGVEDADLTAQHEAELNSAERSWSRLLELHRRAYARLATAARSVAAIGSGPTGVAQVAVDRMGAALARADCALRDWTHASAPSSELRKEHFLVRARLQTLATSADQPSLQPIVDTGDPAQPSEKIRLQDTFASLDAAVKRVDRMLEPKVLALVHAIEDSEDAFFVAANEVAATSIGPAREAMSGLDAAYRDELRRLVHEEQARLSGQVETQARNLAVINNTVRYLDTHSKSGVVLIVDEAHLDAIARELLFRQISVVSGALPSNDKMTEPWEDAAWERRTRPPVSVFCAWEATLEQLPGLADATWMSAEIGRLKFFRAAQAGSVRPTLDRLASGGARLFERVNGRDIAVRVSRVRFDRNADVGRHIVERGIVPGSYAEYYEAIDRQIGRELVKRLSSAAREFAFAFRTNEGNASSYRVATPRGDMRAEDFLESARHAKTSGGPEAVVVFGESDDLLEATRPRVYHTINPERAVHHLDILARQRRERGRGLAFVSDADLPFLDDSLRFTPKRGDYAQVIVLVDRNVRAFREAIARAADTRKLRNKQVALFTCGDAFEVTAELREALLHGGALMVWTPDQPLTRETALRVVQFAKAAAGESGTASATIGELMTEALARWSHDAPDHTNQKAFTHASTWVLNHDPNPVQPIDATR